MMKARPLPPARAYTSRELFGRFWRSYLRPYLPVMLIAFLVTAFMLRDPVEGQWDKPAA